MKKSKIKAKIKKVIKNKNVIYGLIIILLLLVAFSLYKFVLLPQIKLNGKKTMTINYKSEYKEKGFKASFLGNDVTKDVKVSGKVNSNKLGTYKITYKVKEGSLNNKVVRTVHVKDIEKPKLSVTKDDYYVCPGTEFKKEEVKATDNYDGDISSKVKHTLNDKKDQVTYSVKDSSGNKKEVTKNVIYKDIEPPKLTLNGEETVSIYINDNYVDQGIQITDNCDSNLEDRITVDNQVNSNQLGEYTVKYEVKDKSDNSSTIERKVIVKERNRNGTIYLTFDDGPNSGTTDVILDILKEEGVKATFFVTNYGPDELIKREFDEGHTVALHTAVHDYAVVYASDEAYFNDLNSVGERVKRITGVDSKIIRFPGGSSNTVSRRYSAGIMSRITQEAVNRGYKYYDWNISSGDAGATTDPNMVYANVVNNLSKNRVNMVLMHDVKPYTRDALRNIIRYGKENGFTFDKITMDTEMVTQRVNN